jgi:hypothetical protein
LACWLWGGFPLSAAELLERVTFEVHGDSRTVEGRVLVKAQDGGLLVQQRDGRLWTVTAETLTQRKATGQTFKPWTAAELGRQLKKELGPGFSILQNRHYVIASTANPRYSRWCGLMLERLHAAFVTYWKKRGRDLTSPEFPLSAVILRDRGEFGRFARLDAGSAAATAVGYYSVMSNRMVFFDIAAIPGQPMAKTPAEINRRLATVPLAVTTIVHEAVHQLAFNTGLNQRLADNPVWLTEGMAVYFETPDLRSRSGWRTIGRVNRTRLARFTEFSRSRRRPGSLKSLVCRDERFRQETSEVDAYAEAWALSYFLLKTQKPQYLRYLSTISAKPRLIWDTPARRQADFEAAFGDDWEGLEQRFLKYIRRVKSR